MIVGLVGYQGVGKDTVAEYLATVYGFQHRKFTDKLKDSACALFGITREQCEKWKLLDEMRVEIVNTSASVECSFTFREYLQRYGTEAHRDIFGEDFWVDRALPVISNGGTNIVISDCRFPNEAKRITSCGGLLIEIRRPNYERKEDHKSEYVPEAKSLIINDRTIRDMYRQVDLIMMNNAVHRVAVT